jgi:hypothetical protein
LRYTVTEIIDSQSFTVSPEWVWAGRYGNCVRIVTSDTPKDSFAEILATRKLQSELIGAKIGLNEWAVDGQGRLVAAYQLLDE